MALHATCAKEDADLVLTKHLDSVYCHFGIPRLSPSSYSYDMDSTTAWNFASCAAASGARWLLPDLPHSQPFPTQKHFNSLGASSALAPSPQIQRRLDYQRSVSAGSAMLLARSAPLTQSQRS
jgi:hypothetical protein